MSGMFEPKNDKANRKNEQTQKELKAKRKKKIITISVITVLVLVATVAILLNSSFIRRTIPVVTIDGRGFSAAEFEYFFNSEYAEYLEFASQFQDASMLPDDTQLLSAQIQNPDTGETWADFFSSMALASMTEITSLYNNARDAGFRLSEEHMTEIDEELALIAFQAEISGFPSTNMFLQRMFGNSINESVYRNILEFVTTARIYSEHVRESFEYTTDALAAHYNESKDDLDVFNFRMMYVDAEFNEDGLDEEAAAADAYDRAIEIADGILSEEDFIMAASGLGEHFFEPDESTLYRVQGESLEAELRTWLLDDVRDYGDITVIDSGLGSAVIFFINRDDNNYRTVGMRQILISREFIDPDEFPEGVVDPGYMEALDQAEAALHETAELVQTLFSAMGETEDALLELMLEYSDDTTPGGYYPNITKFQYQSNFISTFRVVSALEDWLFDGNRAVGDTEMIYTNEFGYHLVYFTGFGDIFFELIADDKMRTSDFFEWIDGLPKGEPVKHASMILVHF